MEELVQMLIKNNKTISVMESCTGGMLANEITNINDASKVFNYGVVTYSNEAKNKLLGVKLHTLKQYGAVSTQTAMEMAEGVKKVSGADIGISVTGIAGPTGDTKDKPLGLTYIGVSYKGVVKSYKFIFKGDRNKNRELAANNALNIARLTILGKDVVNDLH